MRIVGIGVDIVDVTRVERMLDRYPRFPERVFTPTEVAYCESRANRATSYAGRWAAREATRKALGGIRRMRWHDVRVERAPSGAPRIVLEGTAKERADALGVSEVLISFTHERTMATAFAIAVGEG
ncbi:MAG TPA: holo-ACP synthase [Actinomycetota bacterium]